MRKRVAAAVAVLALGFAPGLAARAPAQNYAQESLDRYFRIEWQVTRDRRGPHVSGYVYNLYQQGTDRVLLRIDRLDASGAVIGTSTAWLLGGVPPDNRAYFDVRVADAPVYRVQVTSFDWVGRGQ
ncbi:MAG TPA: hypothetical protein VGU22_10495 [Methylomirabilota bacterium]|jgi:hypothetical protein|nr:hypothetical protein [Methylomirabilota bacterium]